MNSRELRIGNLVRVNNENLLGLDCKIYEVRHSHVFVNSDDLIHVRTELLQPIPLTEEWLIKFGFLNRKHFCDNRIRYSDDQMDQINDWNLVTYDDYGSFNFIGYDIDNHVLSVTETYTSGSGEFSTNGIDDFSIKNVHRLQNLYYALTGKELELKK